MTKGQMAYFGDLPLVGTDLLNAFIIAVIIIVVAVPEGLPLMIALVLSLNASKMYKDNVLVRKSIGIETAGSINILFSDKTGTITKGHLEVCDFISGSLSNYEKVSAMSPSFKELFLVATLNNSDALYAVNEDGTSNIVGGNATERAVIEFIEVADFLNKEKVEIIETTPFSSEIKYSSSYISLHDQKLNIVKGAPEIIINNTTSYYDEDAKLQPFTPLMLEAINHKIDKLAQESYRILALATQDSTTSKEFSLIGLFCIRDDIRKEAVQAIELVKDASIQVVMITGDRKETAVAIAKDAKILTSESDIVITSDELSALSDDDLKKILKNIRVISRALPSDKLRLVKISQELGLVVGMTGDGVNDSPALKHADVGFAMGSGTEVAKEAAEIIIIDDNFKSIAQAILYGRTIYRSIQKFI
ncbi:MAG: HAD-IC family P-type ATPase, partial [Bacilli bacterium]